MTTIVDIIGGYFGYYGNYITYSFYSILDLIWSPFAMVINGWIGFIEAAFNLVLTLFAWSNVTFSYFVVSMILIFMFGVLVKIILWIKSLIPFV